MFQLENIIILCVERVVYVGVTLVLVLLYIYRGEPLNRHTKSLALYEGNISLEHFIL